MFFIRVLPILAIAFILTACGDTINNYYGEAGVPERTTVGVTGGVTYGIEYDRLYYPRERIVDYRHSYGGYKDIHYGGRSDPDHRRRHKKKYPYYHDLPQDEWHHERQYRERKHHRRHVEPLIVPEYPDGEFYRHERPAEYSEGFGRADAWERRRKPVGVNQLLMRRNLAESHRRHPSLSSTGIDQALMRRNWAISVARHN